MMHLNQRTTVFLLTAVLLLVLAPAGHAGAGRIAGTIRFETVNRVTASAAWTRVYLVRGDIPVPAPPVEHGLIPYSPTDRINTAHQDFYANVQRALAEPGFLAAATLVGEDDAFRFDGIPPGRYYVLVAFPSAIDGYKVAWQVPVLVGPEDGAEVILSRDNLALPTFSRRDGAVIITPGK